MIAYVSGKLAAKKLTEVVVDVQGLGYRLLIPTSTYEVLPEVGAPVHLLTHYYVREDAVLLFGFATEAERTLFEVLLGVSGVGPRLALAALSALSPVQLHEAVTTGDVQTLKRIPGVGQRLAERLIVELRDRLAPLDLAELTPAGVNDVRAQARADALAALEALGLPRAAAERSLRKVLREHPGIQSAEELIRLALREHGS